MDPCWQCFKSRILINSFLCCYRETKSQKPPYKTTNKLPNKASNPFPSSQVDINEPRHQPLPPGPCLSSYADFLQR